MKIYGDMLARAMYTLAEVSRGTLGEFMTKLIDQDFLTAEEAFVLLDSLGLDDE